MRRSVMATNLITATLRIIKQRQLHWDIPSTVATPAHLPQLPKHSYPTVAQAQLPQHIPLARCACIYPPPLHNIPTLRIPTCTPTCAKIHTHSCTTPYHSQHMTRACMPLEVQGRPPIVARYVRLMAAKRYGEWWGWACSPLRENPESTGGAVLACDGSSAAGLLGRRVQVVKTPTRVRE